MTDSELTPFITKCASLLAAQGWESVALGGSSAPPSSLRVHIESQDLRAVLALFCRADETLLVADFVLGGQEEGDSGDFPDPLFERYLDLSRAERLTLWGPCRSLGASWLLCASRGVGCRLLDVALEIPFGHCSVDPADADLEHCLRVLETSASDKRPLADRERLSKDLARWLDLLGGKLGRALGWSRGDVERLGRQLLLGLKCRVMAGEFGCLGLKISRQRDEAVVALELPPLGALVDTFLSAAFDLSPTPAAGAFPPLERAALCRQLQNFDPSYLAVLEGMLKLSAAKFQASIQSQALLPAADGEHASSRMALVDPLQAEASIDSRDLYVFERLELNLSECGLGRVLDAVEQLALFALRQGDDLKRAGGRQLDMIEMAPDGDASEESCDDPFAWLCRHALRLRVSNAFRETIAYLVASRVVDLRAKAEFRDLSPAPLNDLFSLFDI